MNITARRIRAATMILLGTCALSACATPSKFLGKMALNQQASYFDANSAETVAMEQVSERIWTYNWYFDRTMIVDTDDGLVIIDPFSKELTDGLRQALKEAGLDKPVHTLIYTHYHVDHVRSGAALQPQNVICDVRCKGYWDKLPPEDTADILLPTKTIDGDTSFTIGGVRFEMIYFNQAHTDTNYGVYLPDQKTIYLADTIGIRSLLPVGGVSVFLPDYLEALDRVQQLDFDTFVSSHFSWGDKNDFVEGADLQRDAYRWTREAIELVTPEEGDPQMPFYQDKKRFTKAYGYFYDRMKEKYGDWHGFHAQILPTFLANMTAIYIGA